MEAAAQAACATILPCLCYSLCSQHLDQVHSIDIYSLISAEFNDVAWCDAGVTGYETSFVGSIWEVKLLSSTCL